MRRRLLVASLGAAVAFGQLVGTSLAAHAASKSHNQLVAVTRVGSINVRTAATSGGSVGTELNPSALDPGQPSPNKRLRHTFAAGQPSVTTTSVTSSPTGFKGLNHLQQRYAGSGNATWQNTQFSLIPSDQGLCVSSGLDPNFVIEPINDAVRIYNTDGTATSGYIMPLNQFFNKTPELNRHTGAFGDASIGDPECYFDVATQRWFATVYKIGVDTSTGAFIAPTAFLVNVSDSSDPTGTWTTYSVDATDPTGAGAACQPCFPDHPNLGADANGVYVTTDDFSLSNGTFFGGAQLYAFSKSGLESGAATSAVHIDLKGISDWSFSLPPYQAWPAQSPGSSDWDTTNNGTEYVGMGMDIIGAVPIHSVNASSFGVFAVTNTSSLSGTPALTVHFTSTATELYSQPPNAVQQKGPYPLGQGAYNRLLGEVVQGGEELVEADQDFASQTYYAHRTLWNAIETAGKEPNGATVSGIAWFAFTPSATGSSVSAPLAGQGYVAAPGNDLQYPSIASTSDGTKTVMVMDLVGPDYYPSLAYTTLSTAGGGSNSAIVEVAAGTEPLDTFGGYHIFQYQPGMSRQGDYTAAVADSAGNIWIAGQWVQGDNLCLPSHFGDISTCAARANRSLLANWATWIAKT